MKRFNAFVAMTFPIALFLLIATFNSSFGQDEKPALRASEKDSVWIYITHVRPNKRDVFEKFVHKIFFDASTKLSPEEQKVFHQTRILHPTKAENNGSFSYCFLMDPVVGNGEYDIRSLMTKIYGEAEANKHMKMYDESVIDQTAYVMVQSRH